MMELLLTEIGEEQLEKRAGEVEITTSVSAFSHSSRDVEAVVYTCVAALQGICVGWK